MVQLPLFSEGELPLKPIKQFLHVWTEAQREREMKKAAMSASASVRPLEVMQLSPVTLKSRARTSG